jgi:putative transposase
MPRRFRVVVEGRPHHVIQRGCRCQRVFFNDEDRRYYLNSLKKNCDKYGVRIWAYCLMDNHVHLVLVPSDKNVFYRAVADTHQAYTLRINKRHEWRGYLWQGRFISFVMDDMYLLRALRYVERNPVRAGVVSRAQDYMWSSARAHVGKASDRFLSPCAAIEGFSSWSDVLALEDEENVLKELRLHAASGRILGNKDFVETLSAKVGIDLLLKKPGPKPRTGN